MLPDQDREPRAHYLASRASARESGGLPPPGDFLAAFPSELHATDESEAGTVILLEWRAYEVGYYGGGERITGTATAMTLTCRAQVIDKATSKVVARKRFQGSSPPEDILTSQTSSGYSHAGKVVVGGAPTDAIREWLSKFPHEASGRRPRDRSER